MRLSDVFEYALFLFTTRNFRDKKHTTESRVRERDREKEIEGRVREREREGEGGEEEGEDKDVATIEEGERPKVIKSSGSLG